MAVQSIGTLKSYLNTGDKPTEQQFHNVLESYRHKSEVVPAAEVEGLAPITLSVSTATASQAIGAGKLVQTIVIEGGANSQTINIGTSANGNDVIADESLSANEVATISLSYYFKSAGTLHFSGLSGSNVIKIYTR